MPPTPTQVGLTWGDTRPVRRPGEMARIHQCHLSQGAFSEL